jgi:hypothetical protein
MACFATGAGVGREVGVGASDEHVVKARVTTRRREKGLM